MNKLRKKAGPILYIVVWVVTIWFFHWLDGLA